MQRKNSILNSSHRGMAMIMAIMVIVIIATILALSLSLSRQTAKRTVDIYLYEQAQLYSRSAAEKALLYIAKNGPCVQVPDYTLDNNIYNIHIDLRYVYKGLNCGGTFDYFTNLQTNEQNGSVLMDITVDVNDSTIATEPIRYFRRTIQKL